MLKVNGSHHYSHISFQLSHLSHQTRLDHQTQRRQLRLWLSQLEILAQGLGFHHLGQRFQQSLQRFGLDVRKLHRINEIVSVEFFFFQPWSFSIVCVAFFSDLCLRVVPKKYYRIMLLFELAFREWKKLSAFVKTCEALYNHSDTALFKVKPKGLYIMLTDFESLCCLETRLFDQGKNMLKMNCTEYTVKIMLDSFVSILRKVLKNKHSALVSADDETPYVLQIREVIGHTNKTVETHQVESAEHRARVYHVLSTNEFRRRSTGGYVQFRLPYVEFNKLITMQCIVSGNCGGVGEVTATPPDEQGVCKIRFFVRNNGGMGGGVTLHTHAQAASAPLQHAPHQSVRLQYFLTYLKRSQSIFSNPTDSVTVYVSNQGLLLQTDVKDGHCVVVFIADVSQEDLDSYA